MVTQQSDRGSYCHDDGERLQHEMLSIRRRAILDTRQDLDRPVIAMSDVPFEVPMQERGSEQIWNPPLPNLQREPNVAVDGANDHQPANAVHECQSVNAEGNTPASVLESRGVTRLFQG